MRKVRRPPNRIRELRKRPGVKIKLKELAEGCGVSVPYLNRLERGLVGASEDVRERIAQYLDVPVEEVFPGWRRTKSGGS
jgi:transcriptional regulator with XRE-family HTH domain